MKNHVAMESAKKLYEEFIQDVNNKECVILEELQEIFQNRLNSIPENIKKMTLKELFESNLKNREKTPERKIKNTIMKNQTPYRRPRDGEIVFSKSGSPILMERGKLSKVTDLAAMTKTITKLVERTIRKKKKKKLDLNMIRKNKKQKIDDTDNNDNNILSEGNKILPTIDDNEEEENDDSIEMDLLTIDEKKIDEIITVLHDLKSAVKETT